MSWFDELQDKYRESKERLAALPENSFTYVHGGPQYAKKVALIKFNNDLARQVSDFDLMMWYDGNPCFGGHVSRHAPTDKYPHGAATVTVYTD